MTGNRCDALTELENPPGLRRGYSGAGGTDSAAQSGNCSVPIIPKRKWKRRSVRFSVSIDSSFAMGLTLWSNTTAPLSVAAAGAGAGNVSAAMPSPKAKISYSIRSTIAARIRAFFVHPEFARRGIARAILLACEEAMRAENFGAAEMVATLSGEPFYAAFGYSACERYEVPLTNGLTLPVVRMTKQL